MRKEEESVSKRSKERNNKENLLSFNGCNNKRKENNKEDSYRLKVIN